VPIRAYADRSMCRPTRCGIILIHDAGTGSAETAVVESRDEASLLAGWARSSLSA